MIIIVVEATESQYIPVATHMPMAAVAQIPAAVVSPRKLSLRKKIIPAPKKPIPVTICAAILAPSPMSPPSFLNHREMHVSNVEAHPTTKCVALPASF